MNKPVLPIDIAPLPENLVYIGEGSQNFKGRPSHYYRKALLNEWIARDPDTRANMSCLHYATERGDKCHRAQPWFEESQVPTKGLTDKDMNILAVIVRDQISNLRKTSYKLERQELMTTALLAAITRQIDMFLSIEERIKEEQK